MSDLDSADFNQPRHFSSSALALGAAQTNELAEGEPLEQWSAYTPDDIDFTQELEEEETDDPDYCFLCHVSQTSRGSVRNQNLDSLHAYLRENEHRVSPKTLTRNVQAFYNISLRPFCEEPKVWLKAMIWNHIDEHAPTPLSMHEDTLRTLHNVTRVLRNGGVFVKEMHSGKRSIDKGKLELLLKTIRQRDATLAKVRDMRSDALL